MNQDNQKAHFRSSLREYVDVEQKGDWGKLSPLLRSRYMTEFYVKKILRIISPLIVPDDDDDLIQSLTDGSNDHGVDFIYRGEKRVLIIQAKYHQKNEIEDSEKFEYCCNVLARLHDLRSSKRKVCPFLMEAIEDIDWDEDSFEIHFITLGRGSEAIRYRESQGQNKLANLPDIENRTTIYFYDETALNELLRDAENYEELINKPIKVTLAKTEDGSPWICYDNQQRRCFVGVINGTQIYELVKAFRNRLFSLNIRNYLGDLSTNKGIMTTAEKKPEDFFFFNNGISAVATDIEEHPETNSLECKGFSIINGCQTANSLLKVKNRSRDSIDLKKINILIRISEIHYKQDNQDGGFLDCITEYNNTQNAIKLPDFRSNDPIQRDLKQRFEKLTYHGKKLLYRNKRTKEAKGHRIPIQMEEFTKTIHSFLHGPAGYFGGNEYLFGTQPGDGYCKVFGNGTQIWDHITPNNFDYLSGIWFMMLVVKETIPDSKITLLEKEQEDERKRCVKNALEQKYLIYYAVAEILRTHYAIPDELEKTISRLGKTKWLEDNSSHERTTLKSYTSLGCNILVELYEDESRHQNFTHRDWFRNPKYLGIIRNKINRWFDLLRDNIPKL